MLQDRTARDQSPRGWLSLNGLKRHIAAPYMILTRFRAIWCKLCTREQGHAFLDASIIKRRHDLARDES